MKSFALSSLLVGSCLAVLASANDDLVVRGEAPKWNLDSPIEKLTQLCSSEKDADKKLKVCNAAVMRYARLPLKSIPSEARSQALYLIERHESQPKNELYIFGLHDSHITIGRLFLRDGNLEKAKEALTQSLRVPTTPALQTLGPRMTLAADLLAQKEKQAVMNYLDQAEKIWTQNDTAKKKISIWRQEIAAGKIPLFM